MRAAAGVAAGEVVAPEVFGLNKSARLNLPGEGDTVGLAAAVAAAFFAPRFAFGEAAGDAAEAGDAAAGACDPVVCVFLAARFLTGVGDSAGVGVWA